MTICAQCKWLSDSAKGTAWTGWRCVAAPTDEINPVNGEPFVYQLCRFLNKGACPAFEAGKNSLTREEA